LLLPCAMRCDLPQNKIQEREKARIPVLWTGKGNIRMAMASSSTHRTSTSTTTSSSSTRTGLTTRMTTLVPLPASLRSRSSMAGIKIPNTTFRIEEWCWVLSSPFTERLRSDAGSGNQSCHSRCQHLFGVELELVVVEVEVRCVDELAIAIRILPLPVHNTGIRAFSRS